MVRRAGLGVLPCGTSPRRLAIPSPLVPLWHHTVCRDTIARTLWLGVRLGECCGSGDGSRPRQEAGHHSAPATWRASVSRQPGADSWLPLCHEPARGQGPGDGGVLDVVAETFPVPAASVVAFRLELLINIITLHLPTDMFFPARVSADGWLEPDPNFSDVQFRLPKVALVLTQGDSIGDVGVIFAGWGINSLDDPADPEAGELIAMVPPLALHESGVFGFGMQKAVLDLTADFTPPDIMELFGTGDDFTGLWLPHVRLFLAPNRTTGKSFDLHANDLLIDFNHGVSGEFAFEVVNRNTKLPRVSLSPRG